MELLRCIWTIALERMVITITPAKKLKSFDSIRAGATGAAEPRQSLFSPRT